jgi:hypothetical protein
MSIYSDRELSLMNELENGDLFEFKEWPNDAIPTVAAGLYAIWEGQDFIYIGMSGRGMSSTEIEAPDEPKKPKGLFNRLKSHWDGRRSGDQFCVYVCDRLVVPVLNPEQQRLIGDDELSLDTLTQDHIHAHFSYRYAQTTDGSEALTLEAKIQKYGLPSGKKPFLNPYKPRVSKPRKGSSQATTD